MVKCLPAKQSVKKVKVNYTTFKCCDALYCQKALASYYNYYNFVTLFFGCKGAMEDRVNPVFWLAMQVGLQYCLLGKINSLLWNPKMDSFEWLNHNGFHPKIIKNQSQLGIKGGSFVSTAGLYMNLHEFKHTNPSWQRIAL